jgi:hypothetical protein
MALIMRALLFMFEERVLQASTAPLLRCSDIEPLLAHFLPRKAVTREDIVGQMWRHHRKREASSDSAGRRRSPS